MNSGLTKKFLGGKLEVCYNYLAKHSLIAEYLRNPILLTCYL